MSPFIFHSSCLPEVWWYLDTSHAQSSSVLHNWFVSLAGDFIFLSHQWTFLLPLSYPFLRTARTKAQLHMAPNITELWENAFLERIFSFRKHKLSSRNKVQSQQNKNENKLYLSNSETQKDLGGSRHSANCKAGSSSSWPYPVEFRKHRPHTPPLTSVPMDLGHSPQHQIRLGTHWLSNSPAEKGVEGTVCTGWAWACSVGWLQIRHIMSWTALGVRPGKHGKLLSLSDTSEAASGFLGPVLGLHLERMGRDQAEM